MHGKSRVSSAISVCSLTKFPDWFLNSGGSSVGWLGVGIVVTGWCKLKVRALVEIYQFFSAMIFISVSLGLVDFSDMVILCSRPFIRLYIFYLTHYVFTVFRKYTK